MIRVYGHMLSIVVILAIAQHIFWAWISTVDPIAFNATGLNAIYRFIGDRTPLVLVISSVAAIVGLWTRVPWIVLLLVPQQVLLMMSAAGALEAMWLGQFADGVLRNHLFIAADQINAVLFACGHTGAIIAHVRRITDNE